MFGLFLFAASCTAPTITSTATTVTDCFSETNGQLRLSYTISAPGQPTAAGEGVPKQYTWRTALPDPSNPTGSSDREFYIALVQKPNTMRLYLGGAKTPEYAQNRWDNFYLPRIINNSPMAPNILVDDQGRPIAIGVIGLSSECIAGETEVMCIIDEEFQHQGIAKASLPALIEVASAIRRRGLEGDTRFRCFYNIGAPENDTPVEQRILKQIRMMAHPDNCSNQLFDRKPDVTRTYKTGVKKTQDGSTELCPLNDRYHYTINLEKKKH